MKNNKPAYVSGCRRAVALSDCEGAERECESRGNITDVGAVAHGARGGLWERLCI